MTHSFWREMQESTSIIYDSSNFFQFSEGQSGVLSFKFTYKSSNQTLFSDVHIKTQMILHIQSRKPTLKGLSHKEKGFLLAHLHM